MADRTVTDLDKIGAWADQYNLLVADVGDKDTLTTTATTVVTAINEVDGLIGDLTSLTTTAQGSVVASINEVDGLIGDLTSLTTTANSNLVAAINELDGDFALKADLASPALTGTPTAPTATGGTNTTQIATTAYVQGEIAGFAPLASPALTGVPTAPTATTGTSTTQIATTAFVAASVAAAGGGDVLKVGTPVDNQIAVWTGDGTIEGDSGLTWTTGTSTLSVGGNAVWHGGNDGAASGLDADLLDGNHGTHYLDFGNFTNLPDPVITLGGDATGSVTLTDLGSATLTVAIVDDSHNHVIGNVDGLQAALDLKAPLTSPAFLTSATLDGAALATETYVDTELASQVHDAADITTCTLSADRIPNLSASKIDSGTFATARIPSLNTSKITTGTFADARIAESNVTQHEGALTITESQVSDLGAYSEVATGTTAPATTPDAAGDIFVNTTGDVVYVATGTTNSADWLQVSGSGNLSDLGDTTISGGLTAGDFLRYSGSAWVDTPLSASDIPSLDTSKITSGTFANARISEGSVTQHQAALSIAPSQLSGDIALGTDTSGNYVATVTGTANEVEVTGGTGEGTTITVGLPNDVTIGNDLTVTGDIVAGTAHARALTASLSAALTQANSANRIVTISASVAVTDDDFTGGDAIILIASGADRTITPDTNLTIKYDGATIATATIKQDGMASLVFTGANTAFLSGDISATT